MSTVPWHYLAKLVDKRANYCTFECQKGRGAVPLSLSKIIFRHIVVEGQAVGRTELGNNLHDVLLLTGRELVLTMMVAIVRAVAAAEVVLDTTAGF